MLKKKVPKRVRNYEKFSVLFYVLTGIAALALILLIIAICSASFANGYIYAISTLMPAEAETIPVDPMWLYGPVGGIIAWLLGRSRRCAFICGIAGVILADTASAVTAWSRGYDVPLVLGGAGIADAAVISGVTAVLLCELIGETIERLVRAWCERGNEH